MHSIPAVLTNFDLLLFQLMSLLKHEVPRHTISYNISWVTIYVLNSGGRVLECGYTKTVTIVDYRKIQYFLLLTRSRQ